MQSQATNAARPSSYANTFSLQSRRHADTPTRFRLRQRVSAKFHLFAQHLFALKFKEAPERLALEGLRKPKFIVLPHLVERKLIDIEPERHRLFRFDGDPIKARSDKNGAEEAVTVQKLEMQFAPLNGIGQGNSEFLLCFTHDSRQRQFARLEPSADTVDFSGAQSPLFSDH